MCRYLSDWITTLPTVNSPSEGEAADRVFVPYFDREYSKYTTPAVIPETVLIIPVLPLLLVSYFVPLDQFALIRKSGHVKLVSAGPGIESLPERGPYLGYTNSTSCCTFIAILPA